MNKRKLILFFVMALMFLLLALSALLSFDNPVRRFIIGPPSTLYSPGDDVL